MKPLKILVLVAGFGLCGGGVQASDTRDVVVGSVDEVMVFPLRKGAFVSGRMIDTEGATPAKMASAERTIVRIPKKCADLAVTAMGSDDSTAPVLLRVSGTIHPGITTVNSGGIGGVNRTVSLQFDYGKGSDVLCSLVTYR